MQATCILRNVVPWPEIQLFFLCSVKYRYNDENLPKYRAKDFLVYRE